MKLLALSIGLALASLSSAELYCGADISALNANDYSSKAAMELVGWTMNSPAFKSMGGYEDGLAPGYSADNAFWGWHGGAPVGWVQYEMDTTGSVTLKYGRAHPSGTIKVKLNGAIIGTTQSNPVTINFDVVKGDILRVEEHGTSVIAIYDINVCSPTPSPTTTPTGTPTATPTGTPTGTPTTAEAFALEEARATSLWQTGQIGDTVYMCLEKCFENTAADRSEFKEVASTPAIQAVLDDHLVHTVTDGRFDMNGEGVTYSKAGSENFFPWDCICSA